ncbi:MAG: hypothetical protein ACQESP_05625 [Candidatus Muiribacteriota bacterium]
MAVINPVDINTHLAQSFNVGKVKQAQEAHAVGESKHAALLKEKEERDQTSVKKIDKTENSKIDADSGSEKNNEDAQKRKKNKNGQKHKKNTLNEFFGVDESSKGNRIDIKL